MCLMEVPQEEIDRVLRHPLPTRRYPFDAVALHAQVAGCVSITEEEKYSMIDGFMWISATRAAKLSVILTAERDTWKSRNDAYCSRVRSTFHVVR